MKLTLRSKVFYDCIIDICNRELRPPTIREACMEAGIRWMQAGVKHMDRLVDAGLMERHPTGARRGYMPVRWRARMRAMIHACDGLSTKSLVSMKKGEIFRRLKKAGMHVQES